MAFQHGNAFAASLNDWAGVKLGSRGEPIAYPYLKARNESSADNGTETVNLFVDSNGNTEYEYAASIVTACVDQTVYAIQCTAGPSTTYVAGLGTIDSGCGPDGAVLTVTEGTSTYAVSTSTSVSTAGHNAAVLIKENCKLSGTTAAVCTGVAGVSVDGTSTTTTVTATMTGTDYARYDVAITGGADKTKNPTATCATSNAAPGTSTKGLAVWALATFAGVTGLLAL